jgi:hypothetical protein
MDISADGCANSLIASHSYLYVRTDVSSRERRRRHQLCVEDVEESVCM